MTRYNVGKYEIEHLYIEGKRNDISVSHKSKYDAVYFSRSYDVHTPIDAIACTSKYLEKMPRMQRSWNKLGKSIK